MNNEIDLCSFVKGLGGVSNGAACNYRKTPSIINIFNSMVDYESMTPTHKFLIPTVCTDKTDTLSFRFNTSDISDMEKFSECIKKYSEKPLIKENLKTKTITVKI